ncbi:MAG: TrkH family potassium uptake protein [Salinivirgaceae bacterium]|nr:TrkH family potassium uptake protein [Salinivirgaceae bacterium]
MNIAYIINAIGRISIVIALFMSTCVLWAIYYSETHVYFPLGISIFISLVLGIIMVFGTHYSSKNINLKDKYIIVVVSWLFIGVLGALPYYISGNIPSFIDAMFESLSGFSTTGSTILTDIEALPRSILYWRSLTHWIGGMGIIVLVIAVFPMFKTIGYQMFSLEASGLLNQKLKPRTSDIAKRLWSIYIGLTVILVGLLMWGGMDFYESLCHSFGTIATGGFSTKNSSVGFYSPYIQYVITIFMLLSGMNFTLHYFLIKGNFKRLYVNSELRLYLFIIAVVTLIISAVLIVEQNYDTELAFRESFFQVVSMLTTTGYATTDYLLWPTQAWILIFGLMFIGGCVGSTAGGVKVIRHVVAFKYLKKQLSLLVHPNAIKVIKINQRSVQDNQAITIIVFIMFYIIIFAIGVFIMSIMGLDLQTAMGSVISTMGSFGPGIGTVGPAANFAHIPDVGKIVLTLLMVIGRLEIFTFMIILTPDFWKKQISN